MDSENKICQNCQREFQIEPADFEFYEKIKVPPPTWCPDCRMKLKLVWRNERTLYKRKCDLCGHSIITVYHPRHPAPVYCNNCYHSDKWNPYSFGLDYNPQRPFFEQLSKLIFRIPKDATQIGTSGSQNINSEYVSFASGNKNAYLIFNSAENEDCSYSRGIVKSKDTFDAYFADKAELCYEGVNIIESNKVLWCQNTTGSFNSYFCLNCSGVQNCFGCVNLRYKSYHFFNEPLSKDEWQKRVSEILGSHKKIEKTKKQFQEFSSKFPRRENNSIKVVNCTGDYIFKSKNCFSCFETLECEDCKYGFAIKFVKDSYDLVGRGFYSELLLEAVATGHGCSRVIGSWAAESSHNIEYSFDIRASENCIGCAGLKHAEYCILNKKYSKEDYNKIRNQIIEELKNKNLYGLYFPPDLSPWAYNETLAQELFPADKKKVIAQGFRWEDDIPRTKGKETLPPEEIPDHINDVPDSIVKEILKCTSCGYNYRLTTAELEFYRKMQIPVPRKCFNCRHLERLERRGPYKLYSRPCGKCNKPIQTTYSPDRKEIVYCEKCYQAEVV